MRQILRGAGRGTGHRTGTQEEVALTCDAWLNRLLARETAALLCPSLLQTQPEGNHGDQDIQRGHTGRTVRLGSSEGQASGKAILNLKQTYGLLAWEGITPWVVFSREKDVLGYLGRTVMGLKGPCKN